MDLGNRTRSYQSDRHANRHSGVYGGARSPRPAPAMRSPSPDRMAPAPLRRARDARSGRGNRASGAHPVTGAVPFVRPGYGQPATPAHCLDYGLVLTIAGLLCFGLVMVYSASTMGQPGDPSYYFRRELLWVALGIVAMLIVMQIDYHHWRRISALSMLVALALLLLVMKFGVEINGAQRWIAVGHFFTFEPSEVTKLALIIYVADWLSRKGEEVSSFLYGLVPFALFVGLVLLLVMLENDMGTTIIIGGIALAMFFMAGANLLQLVPALGIGGLLFLLLSLAGFRHARMVTFIHPLGNCLGSGWQICQSLYALGSGGWFGLGLGVGRQKAGFLPFPWTDSIYAVTGEELGFIGCLAILALFATFAYRGFRVARQAPNLYSSLLAMGITFWIILQAIINIGSVIDAIPFTGVPLPFISFGGSSLVTSLAAIGILLNVSRYTQTDLVARSTSDRGSGGYEVNDARARLRRRYRRTHLPGFGSR
jgi:cell division protein FtsW